MNTTRRTRIVVAVAGIVLAGGIGAAVAAAADDAGDDPPIPVEPDGGIGETPIPVEPDGGIGETPIPVEPDGGIGDTPAELGVDEFPLDAAREEARGLLGRWRDDLPADVRIAREGDAWFAMTEDHVLGRVTVELDHEDGRLRVTVVTVELPDGPETFVLEPS